MNLYALLHEELPAKARPLAQVQTDSARAGKTSTRSSGQDKALSV